MTDLTRAFAVLSCLACACDRESASGPSGAAAIPEASSVAWDEPEGEVRASSSTSYPTLFSRSASASAVHAIWYRLRSYRGSFLRHWRDTFDAPAAPEPAEAAAALEELILAINGPAGFWRKTVATSWLGCDDDPDSEPCRRLVTLYADLAEGDTLLHELEALPPRQAARFLAKNETRIVAYLETCVPHDASATALEQTALYRAHLDEVLAHRVGGARLSHRDL